MLKIALAAGAISMAVATDCNGVYFNSYTAMATDVCMNIVSNGTEVSHMVVCDDDGDSATYTLYSGADCDDADYMNSTDVMDAGLNASYVVCNATDCDYALVTEYTLQHDVLGPETTTPSPTTLQYSTTSSGLVSDSTTGWGFSSTATATPATPAPVLAFSTTATPAPESSTSKTPWYFSTTASTTTVDCDQVYDTLTLYQGETALVMLDCLDLNGNDTLWFQWSCDEETDDLTMQYYIGGNCTGGTLALEQSYTNDSCATVMCSSSDDTDSSSSDDTDSSVDESTSGAASLEHLVATLFAVIALVAN